MFGEDTVGFGGAVTFGVALAVIGIYLMLNAQNATSHIVAFFIVALPLANSPYLPGQVFGIRGLSPVNFLTVIACVAVFSKVGMSGRLYGYIVRFVPFSLAICIVVFVCSAAVTYFAGPDHLYYLGPNKVTSFRPGKMDFLLYECIRPLQIMIVGFLVMIVCDLQDGKRIIQRALLLAPVALSVLGLFFSMQVELEGYSASREELGIRLGLHGNDFGALSLYFLVAALTMRNHDWPRMRYVAIGFALLGIVLSYSRIAFVATIILFALLYFKLSAKDRAIVSTLAGIVILLFLAQLIERATYGLADSPGGVDLNAVSAGRWETIWVPALKQFLEKPIFGYGIGVLVDLGGEGRVEAHNAYLVVILSMGLVGLLAILNVLFWAFRFAIKNGHEIRYLLVVMLILNMTGHGFFPSHRNYVLWVFFGMLLHTVREQQKAKSVVTSSPQLGNASFPQNPLAR